MSPEPAPFVMPDLTGQHALGAELTHSSSDAGLSVMTLDLHGQFAIRPNLTVFGRMPVSHASFDALDGSEETDTGIGNLSLGGRFTMPTSNRMIVGGTLAIALPTASIDEDSGFASFIAATARFPVLGRYLPETMTVSASAEFRHDAERFFVQGQLGLDLHMPEEELGDEDLSLLRAGLAGGIKLTPQLALIGEFTTISAILEDTSDEDDVFLHWVDIGVRYSLARAVIGARVFIPVDEEFDELVDPVGLGVDVTARF